MNKITLTPALVGCSGELRNGNVCSIDEHDPTKEKPYRITEFSQNELKTFWVYPNGRYDLNHYSYLDIVFIY